MYKKKCRCGETEKSFKFDIGEFFISECCEKAGYDEYGKLPEDYEKEAENMADQLLEEKPKSSEPSLVDKIKAQEEKIKAKRMGEKIADKAKEVADKIMKEGISDKSIDDMTAKEMMAYCEENGIKYSKRDTKKKLLKRIKG